MRTVVLDGWHRALPDHFVSGSLYAMPSPARLEAARALHEARCRVHVDVIVGPDGHRGVTWAELYAVRDLLPAARIDLHLIVLHDQPCPDETLAVRAASDLGLESVATAAPQISRNRAALDALRRDGLRLYEQVSPPDAGPAEPLAGLDGALVMLVPPGTRQAADTGLLGKVETLARTLPVAVDGGITSEIAHRCRETGAGFVVSGRSLLSYAPPGTPPGPPASSSTTRTDPSTNPPERRSA